MPDAALGRNSGLRPDLSRVNDFPLVSTSSMHFSTRHQRFACARLSEPHLTGSSPAFSATLTTIGSLRQQLAVVWSLPLIAGSEGPPSSPMQLRTSIAVGVFVAHVVSQFEILGPSERPFSHASRCAMIRYGQEGEAEGQAGD